MSSMNVRYAGALLLVVVGLAACDASARRGRPTERELVRAYLDAASRGDAQAIRLLISPLIVPPEQAIQTRLRTYGNRPFYEVNVELRYAVYVTSAAGSTAFLSGSTTDGTQHIPFRDVLSLVQVDNRWYLTLAAGD